MLDWLRKIRKVSQKLTLPSRDATAGRSQIQLNPAKLTPSSEIYLSSLSQLHLVISDLLQQDSLKAPDSNQSEAQAILAGSYRDRSKQLDGLLIRLGASQMELQSDIRERLEQLVMRTEGADWFEDLMRIYVVFGILQDGAAQVSKGLPAAKKLKVDQLLESKKLEKFCESELASGIAKVLPNPVKDNAVALAREQFKILEPFTSALIAKHTVRMDLLGLTA